MDACRLLDALSVDGELTGPEGVTVRRHVAIPLAVHRQLRILDNRFDLGCACQARFCEHHEDLFIELDQQLVRALQHEGHSVQIVARPSKFSLRLSHVHRMIGPRDSLDRIGWT